jgi:hypothetical protein
VRDPLLRLDQHFIPQKPSKTTRNSLRAKYTVIGLFTERLSALEHSDSEYIGRKTELPGSRSLRWAGGGGAFSPNRASGITALRPFRSEVSQPRKLQSREGIQPRRLVRLCNRAVVTRGPYILACPKVVRLYRSHLPLRTVV